MKYNYKDPERVECLKKDWDELQPSDQLLLLIELEEETVEDFKTDWKGKLLKIGKWLLIAIAGLIATVGAFFMTSCTFSQSQVGIDGSHKETSLQVNPVGDSISGLFNFIK